MSDLEHSKVLGIFNKRAIPEGVTPVQDFELEKYLGQWYDIARINFRWEDEDTTNVFVNYSLRKDGFVKVENTGYDEKDGKWHTSVGKAKFRTDDDVAALDVSFSAGLSWSGYNVISVDDEDENGNYKYALVFGRNLDLMWILSREIEIPLQIQEKYLKIAEEAGYDTSRLTWTNQDKNLEKLKNS